MAGLFVMVTWYVMKDTMQPRVWDWHSVEQGADLTFLGVVTNDRPQLSLICANLGLASTKGRHSETKRVYFIPAGDDVNGDEVFALLGSIRYSACTMALGAPLSQTPNTLFAAREADSVVVIVEEGCSALADIELIIRELKIAGVEPAGFIYLPTSKRSSR
ncbi:hypothetical protein ACTQ2S_04880 [Parolsenella catena]|uniref:hypothetical protein n=1 Tax=Parolsenella catena TaxID=2003188 RepID=UPI003F99C166